ILGDGETQEGQVWEAAMAGPKLGQPDRPLDNLCVILDYNKIQLDNFVAKIMDLEPVVAKWQSFGWPVLEIDRHDRDHINKARDPRDPRRRRGRVERLPQGGPGDTRDRRRARRAGEEVMAAKASRVAFGEALLELGARDERIVTVDADLSKSTMTAKFAKTYPGRAFNVGIAESNMIGIGAGLALAGRIPFVCSFACFVVGRFETIRISVAY